MPLPTDRDVHLGDGSILDTAGVVRALGGKRVLLVCGRTSFETSGAARLLDDLSTVAEVHRWSDFRPNTDAEDLLEGLRASAEFAPDTIVGVGGGSAMDMSKLLCAYQEVSERGHLEERIRRGIKIAQRDVCLVLAPTTAGSGSEATHFAVVYIGQDKYSIAGPAMLPDAVILDPQLMLSGSAYQRATSGVDALAQAIESLWSAGATEESRDFARAALELVVPALPDFVNRPTTTTAQAMTEGSHLAGRAIDISKTTAAHALSYGITKGFGVSHGHAVALTLGGFIAAHTEAGPGRLQPGVEVEHHRAVMAEILTAIGATGAGDARAHFVDFCRSLGLDMSLAECGLTTDQEVYDLAAQVNVERLGNNPVMFDVAGLAALVAEAR